MLKWFKNTLRAIGEVALFVGILVLDFIAIIGMVGIVAMGINFLWTLSFGG